MQTVEELDEAWSKDRRQYMIKGRFGWTIPRVSCAVIYIGVGILFSFFSLFLLFWIFFEKTIVSALTFLGIMGVAVVFFLFAKHEFRQVKIYQQAHQDYLEARSRLPNPSGKPPSR